MILTGISPGVGKSVTRICFPGPLPLHASRKLTRCQSRRGGGRGRSDSGSTSRDVEVTEQRLPEPARVVAEVVEEDEGIQVDTSMHSPGSRACTSDFVQYTLHLHSFTLPV